MPEPDRTADPGAAPQSDDRPALHDDLALLSAAAVEAGRLARSYWGRDLDQRDKGDGQGPVSEADLAVDRLLHARLRGARPGYGWLSEESPDDQDRHAASRSFIVDPIDGTRSFLARERVWAQSLAIIENGVVLAGVVHLPMLRRTYAAARGLGATLNGAEIRAGTRAALDGAEVLTNAAGLDPAAWPGGVPPVVRAFRPSLAYRLCLVAEGRYDAMLTLRDAWEWDVAAGALIAGEAGAVVTDRRGRRPMFNAAHPATDGLVAAGAAVHAGLMGRLDPDARPGPVTSS